MQSLRRSSQLRCLVKNQRLYASDASVTTGGEGGAVSVPKGDKKEGGIVIQGPSTTYDHLTEYWNPNKLTFGWRPDQPLGWHGMPGDGGINYRASEYYVDPEEFASKRLAIANPRAPDYIIDFINTPPKGTAPPGTWIAINAQDNFWHYEFPRIFWCFVLGWFWFYAQNMVIWKRPPMLTYQEFWTDYEIRSWYKERQVAPDKPVILNPISRGVPGWIRYSQDLDKWAEWEAEQPKEDPSFYDQWFGQYFHAWFGW